MKDPAKTLSHLGNLVFPHTYKIPIAPPEKGPMRLVRHNRKVHPISRNVASPMPPFPQQSVLRHRLTGSHSRRSQSLSMLVDSPLSRCLSRRKSVYILSLS